MVENNPSAVKDMLDVSQEYIIFCDIFGTIRLRPILFLQKIMEYMYITRSVLELAYFDTLFSS